ncbi:hypothetical protein HNY73_013789 [Argiope bruennichi]|uniref:Uncharacterized protein n=1 Tax=Argiope bruennichi TaxID=94029 RepID=A0A8T0EQU7_ARGBR|nr:hypothetical protein HNY73_013789 [Argiope bruennichi]
MSVSKWWGGIRAIIVHKSQFANRSYGTLCLTVVQDDFLCRPADCSRNTDGLGTPLLRPEGKSTDPLTMLNTSQHIKRKSASVAAFMNVIDIRQSKLKREKKCELDVYGCGSDSLEAT